MESKDKLRILLQHWIDHNLGHVEEFDKWRQAADDEGEKDIAANIQAAMAEMGKANEALAKALDLAGGKPDHDSDHHHHHHHH